MSGLQRVDEKWFRKGQKREVERQERSTSIDRWEGWPMDSYNAGLYDIMQFNDSK